MGTKKGRPPNFLPIIREVFVGEPTFEVSPGVNTGRGVRLKEYEVATPPIITAKEMIEADLEDLRGGGIASDVPAEFAIGGVCANHHGKRVPTIDRCDALFELEISWIWPFLLDRDRVAVGGVGRHIGDDAPLLRLFLEQPQQNERALMACDSHHRLEGL